MTFGNADIEHTVGHLRHRDVHRAACGHGWRNAYNLIIGLGQFQKGVSEDILILRWLVLVVAFNQFARVGIELAWGVPYRLVVFCWGITVAFLRMQVEQLGTFHVFELLQDTHQFLHVVTIEGTEVTYVHALEDVLLLGNGTLQGIRQTNDAFLTTFGKKPLRCQPSRGLETYGIIGLVGTQSYQVFLHAAHGAVDRHIIVVQDDEQVIG